MNQLQFEAKKLIVEGSSLDDFNITVVGFDESEVLSQFSVKEKLESVDKSDILDYLHALKLEEE